MGCNSLEEVRENIDRIDRNIIELIAERGVYVLQAALYKQDTVSVQAPKRVEAVIEKVRNYAAEFGADPDMVEKLYREMIAAFIMKELDEFKVKGK